MDEEPLSNSTKGKALMLSMVKDLIETNNDESNKTIIEYIEMFDGYDMVYPHGETVFHWACAYNNLPICKYMLETKHIHVNISNYRSATALYYACMKNSIDVVKFLISKNVNPMMRSGFSGQFPHEITTSEEIKKILLEHSKQIVAIDYYSNYKIIDGFSLYNTYDYRDYMYWLSNLDYYFGKGNNKNFTIGEKEISPNAKKIHSEEGIAALSKHCDYMLEKYILSLSKEKSNKLCLFCRKGPNDNVSLKLCGKCKKVYFCDKNCQKQANLIHNFDCK